jgi:hypothetical protein
MARAREVVVYRKSQNAEGSNTMDLVSDTARTEKNVSAGDQARG